MVSEIGSSEGNGIFYGYPATKVMFCKGNGTEKQRLGGPSVDCAGDVVVDLFAGIGYFTLPFLVLGNAAHVFACDINPDSVAALRSNVARNGVSSRCTIYQGIIGRSLENTLLVRRIV